MGLLSEILNSHIRRKVNYVQDLDLVFIAGPPGAGKDTIADYLVDNYGYTKVRLADIIYDEAYKRGMTKKDRALLQSIGMEIRAKGDDMLVNLLLNKVNGLNRIVVSDCRDKIEYINLIEAGFTPIRVDASLDYRVERLSKRDGIVFDDKEIKQLNNPLEVALDEELFFNISNDDDIKTLYSLIKQIWS